MRRHFGTDGVRGVVGQDLTVDLVERLGKAATMWSGRGRVFVGRDTRGSGPEVEEAFARGVVAAGGNAVLAGVLPTPAVALLALGLIDGVVDVGGLGDEVALGEPEGAGETDGLAEEALEGDGAGDVLGSTVESLPSAVPFTAVSPAGSTRS